MPISTTNKLIRDTNGAVISIELFVLASIALIGLPVAIATTRDAVVSELSDVAGSIQDSNQSYSYNGSGYPSSRVAGSNFDDALDITDSPNDIGGTADNCITFNGALINEIEPPPKPPASTDAQVLNYDFSTAPGASDSSPFGANHNGTLQNGASVSGVQLQLDGINDRVLIPNSADINLQTVRQRTIALEFTADDVNDLQVLFETGGGIRGMNIYIENGQLYVGSYNLRETVYRSFLSTTISAGVTYSVALTLDANNTVQPGAFRGFINGQVFGSAAAAQVNRHSGAIGLGGVQRNTVTHNGVLNAPNNAPAAFGGTIGSLQIYNRVLSDDEICSIAE